MQQKFSITFFILFVLNTMLHAQVVSIPDSNFRNALITSGIDANSNGQIELAEAQIVTNLSFPNKNIYDLTGIQSFTSLEYLKCDSNHLTSLNLTGLDKLITLNCSFNEISSIEFDPNVIFSEINASNNRLITLSHVKVSYLYLSDNLLTKLDARYMRVQYVNTLNNPDLASICLDQGQLEAMEYYGPWDKDATTQYNTDCPFLQGEVKILDKNFMKALLNHGVDENSNGMIERSEALATSSLFLVNPVEHYEDYMPVVVFMGLNIADMTGIEEFKNLISIIMDNNNVVSLNIKNLTKLKELSCSGNKLTSLDLSNNLLIADLDCKNNQIGSLDVSKQTALAALYCQGNGLNTLNLSNNTQLRVLYCSDNNLTELDVTKLPYLNTLYFHNNRLTTIDLSRSYSITHMGGMSNLLTSLNIDKCTGLGYLNLYGNKISTLNLSKNTQLGSLYINYNRLVSLDISKIGRLSYFDCSGNPALSKICANQTQVNEWNANYYSYNWTINSTTKIEVCAPVTFNLPDSTFRSALLAKGYDTNLNGVIEYNEVVNIDTLIIPNLEIQSLKGIEFFSNLVYLNCAGNKLDTLNVGKNFKLAFLKCSNNLLSNIQLAQSGKLIHLICNNNNLASLNLSLSPGLVHLFCGNNRLTTLNTSENASLRRFSFHNNQFTKINLGQNLNLDYVSCSNNKLIRLDANKNLKLKTLYCNNNELTELAINLASNLEALDCRVNNLTEICIHPNHVSRTKSWGKSNAATWTNCELRGLYFDGVDDKATVPYHAAYNIGAGDFTIESWINNPSYAFGQGTIISNQSYYQEGFVFMIYNEGKQLRLEINGYNYYSTILPTLYDNNCHHIAVSRLGSTITFYLDGAPKGTAASSVPIRATAPLSIGNFNYDNAPFKGYLNEIRFWNIGRTSAQINNDMYTLLSDQPNLIGYWKLKEGSGQLITDHSPIANHGSLGTNAVSPDVSDPSRQSLACFSNDRTESFVSEEISKSKEGFYIGPNPFTGTINLSLNSTVEGTYFHVKIFNSSAILVEERTIEGSEELTLGQDLKPGIYYIKISGNGDEKVVKVVKL